MGFDKPEIIDAEIWPWQVAEKLWYFFFDVLKQVFVFVVESVIYGIQACDRHLLSYESK